MGIKDFIAWQIPSFELNLGSVANVIIIVAATFIASAMVEDTSGIQDNFDIAEA